MTISQSSSSFLTKSGYLKLSLNLLRSFLSFGGALGYSISKLSFVLPFFEFGFLPTPFLEPPFSRSRLLFSWGWLPFFLGSPAPATFLRAFAAYFSLAIWSSACFLLLRSKSLSGSKSLQQTLKHAIKTPIKVIPNIIAHTIQNMLLSRSGATSAFN